MATLGVVAHEVSLGPTEVVLRGREVQLEWTARYSVHIADILRALSQQFADQHQEAALGGQPPLAEDHAQPAAEEAADAGASASAWQAVGESDLVLIGQGLEWEELSGPSKIKAQPKATMQAGAPPSVADTAESMPPAQEVSTKAKKPKAKKPESDSSGQLAETSASQELASRLKHPPPLQPPPPVPTKAHGGSSSLAAPAKAKAPRPEKASSAAPAMGSGPVPKQPPAPSQDVGVAGGSGPGADLPPPPPPIRGVAAPLGPPPPPPIEAAHATVAAAADPPAPKHPLEPPPPPPPIGAAAAHVPEAAAADPPAPPVAKAAVPNRFGTGASPANTQAARVQGAKQLECKTQ